MNPVIRAWGAWQQSLRSGAALEDDEEEATDEERNRLHEVFVALNTQWQSDLSRFQHVRNNLTGDTTTPRHNRGGGGSDGVMTRQLVLETQRLRGAVETIADGLMFVSIAFATAPRRLLTAIQMIRTVGATMTANPQAYTDINYLMQRVDSRHAAWAGSVSSGAATNAPIVPNADAAPPQTRAAGPGDFVRGGTSNSFNPDHMMGGGLDGHNNAFDDDGGLGGFAEAPQARGDFDAEEVREGSVISLSSGNPDTDSD